LSNLWANGASDSLMISATDFSFDFVSVGFTSGSVGTGGSSAFLNGQAIAVDFLSHSE
jgi:hypothetical protein